MGSETCIFKIFADFDVILAIFGAIKFEKITFSGNSCIRIVKEHFGNIYAKFEGFWSKNVEEDSF